MAQKTFKFAGQNIVIAHITNFGARGFHKNREVFIEFLGGRSLKEAQMTFVESESRVDEIDKVLNGQSGCGGKCRCSH